MQIKCMIIGAYKAGTTSLKNYLGEHPEISTHHQLEFDYFIDHCNSDLIHKKFNEEFNLHPNTNYLLAKHVELYRVEEGIKNLVAYNPNIKLIFLVRDPVQRAYSAWKMEVERADYQIPFDDIIKVLNKQLENDHFYKLAYKSGLYGKWYQQICKHVPSKNILLVKFEDLKNKPSETCNEVISWLGLEPYKPNVSVIHNESKVPKSKAMQGMIKSLSQENNPIKKTAKKIIPYKYFTKIGHKLREANQSKKSFPPINPDTASKLYKFYEKDIELFEELTNKKFTNWKNYS